MQFYELPESSFKKRSGLFNTLMTKFNICHALQLIFSLDSCIIRALKRTESAPRVERPSLEQEGIQNDFRPY